MSGEPAIELGPPRDWTPVDAALDRLEQYEWLVFSSSNGVRSLLDRLLDAAAICDELAFCKLAAIGPGTAAELARYHLRADLSPAEYRAESLADALLTHGAAGGRLLLVRADRGRQVLPERLTQPAEVEQVVVYSTSEVVEPRGGGFGGARRRPHRLGDGDEFVDCPVAGGSVWRSPAAQPPGQHQPHHVRGAARVGSRAGGRGRGVYDAGAGCGDRGGQVGARRPRARRRANGGWSRLPILQLVRSGPQPPSFFGLPRIVAFRLILFARRPYLHLRPHEATYRSSPSRPCGADRPGRCRHRRSRDARRRSLLLAALRGAACRFSTHPHRVAVTRRPRSTRPDIPRDGS